MYVCVYVCVCVRVRVRVCVCVFTEGIGDLILRFRFVREFEHLWPFITLLRLQMRWRVCLRLMNSWRWRFVGVRVRIKFRVGLGSDLGLGSGGFVSGTSNGKRPPSIRLRAMLNTSESMLEPLRLRIITYHL